MHLNKKSDHNMKKIYAAVLLLFWGNLLLGQDKMIVNQEIPHTKDYEQSVELQSIDSLPNPIKKRIDRFLAETLGTLRPNLKFDNGEVVDLKTYFENDTLNRNWIVPKYELNFSLQDLGIGIKRYHLQLKLDEYGQILFANWPKEGFADQTQFITRAEIEKFALETAKTKSFDLRGYRVDLAYREKLDTLCWIFKFPAELGLDYEKYDVLEIDWRTSEIAFEGQLVETSVD